MLTRPEREQVEQALAEALSYQANPRSLIQVIFLDEASAILLDIPPGITASDIASFTLTACLLSRWTRNPSLLEMLLNYLVDRKGHGEFKAVLTRVKQGVDPNPSVYDSHWLISSRHPFFDRHDLRRQTRFLVEENARPILRVSADERSFGRTYSRRFLEHLEDCAPELVHVLPAAVSRDAGPSYQVDDLLADLSGQFMKRESFPERVTSSYPKAVAQWLLRQMIANDGLWLVVLDGFGQRPLGDGVAETIEKLAELVTIGQYRRRIRLVLLDYPHELPEVSPADVLEEALLPAAGICRADLEPCLAAWDAERRKHGLTGVAAGRLAELAEEILGKAPPEGKERLRALNYQLVALRNMPGGGLDGAI